MTLRMGDIRGDGVRSYLCLRGGFNVPDYLGSKSTFTLGQFGGHAARAAYRGCAASYALLLQAARPFYPRRCAPRACARA
jgi:hypothetical protein